MSATKVQAESKRRLYRIHQEYAGSYVLHIRDVYCEQVHYLCRSGWRVSEISARYRAMEILNQEYTKECDSIWKAPVAEE